MQYLLYNHDDSPLYLFESSIENNKQARDIIKDYQVPFFAENNLFEVVSWVIAFNILR